MEVKRRPCRTMTSVVFRTQVILKLEAIIAGHEPCSLRSEDEDNTWKSLQIRQFIREQLEKCPNYPDRFSSAFIDRCEHLIYFRAKNRSDLFDCAGEIIFCMNQWPNRPPAPARKVEEEVEEEPTTLPSVIENPTINAKRIYVNLLCNDDESRIDPSKRWRDDHFRQLTRIKMEQLFSIHPSGSRNTNEIEHKIYLVSNTKEDYEQGINKVLESVNEIYRTFESRP